MRVFVAGVATEVNTFAVSDLTSAITRSTLTVDNGILAGNTVFGDAISSGDRT